MLEDVPGTTVLTGIWMFIVVCILFLISTNVEKIRDNVEKIKKEIEYKNPWGLARNQTTN